MPFAGNLIDFKTIVILQQSSNTYVTYSNIAKKHIIPFLGSKKLTEINRGDIYRLYQDRAGYSKYIARLVKTVMNVSFQYALKRKLVSANPAEGIDLQKSRGTKPYHTRNIDTAKTLDIGQILKLLEASKETPMHMQVLFNVLMGLRRQEINGIPIYTVNRRFEEIDVPFQDGSHIVYVNGSYKGDDAVGRLMYDFGCKESKDMYYPELAKGVKHFKEEGGRKIMCEAVEKYAESYAEKYAERKRIDVLYESVKNLMETMKLSAEQAMSAIKVSENDRAVLQKRL